MPNRFWATATVHGELSGKFNPDVRYAPEAASARVGASSKSKARASRWGESQKHECGRSHRLTSSNV